MAERKIIMEAGSALPPGVTVYGDRINFSVEAELNEGERLWLLIYDVTGSCAARLEFKEWQRLGNVYYMAVRRNDCGMAIKTAGDCIFGDISSYKLVAVTKDGDKERVIPDKRAKRIIGRESWADNGCGEIRNGFISHMLPYCIGEETEAAEAAAAAADIRPDIPLSELIIYRMHVRGFTMHESSEVSARGTFKGIMEKIPYLKELGVNYVELMPAYEFDELGDIPGKINYWGYTNGYYMAPKASYASGKNETGEFKKLVRELHKEGIMLGMEFYFVPGTDRQFALETLRYWAAGYNVDGFHVNENVLPVEIILADPLLKECKIFGNEWSKSFMYDIGSFVKGDGGKTESFAAHLIGRMQKKEVNFLATHDSFTVNDMVSYDKKHNEANGEENRDGDEYGSYTWNCGAEGATTDRNIQKLRLKQIKNAWTMLMLSQGVPAFMAGDEFGRTTRGNNNPYCQDNEISWINWHLKAENSELIEFVKMLIKFRKKHKILHMPVLPGNGLREKDFKYFGYPDVSFHGKEAWRPDYSWESRMLGVMYNEKYSEEMQKYIYFAVNMHWEKQKTALPKLPDELFWKLEFTTAIDDFEVDMPVKMNFYEKSFMAEARSVYVFVSSDN